MSRSNIMDEATDFEDKESLGHPRSQVYAIFDDAETARRVAKELNQIGIEPAGIGLLLGNEDAAKLDAATGEHGFLAKVARMGLEMGDTDTDYLGFYRRALLEGHAVLAVVTRDDASRAKVRTLLKTSGAHAMTYFGQFSTEIWEG
jgi:inactivated superfamily I helicase